VNISLHTAGKKFYHEWIFRRTNLEFTSAQKSVVLGPNGSGKSTLLQLIAGAIIPTEGSIVYRDGNYQIPPDEIYQSISFASPYLELIEEFTLEEIIRFNFRFKNSINNYSEKQILELSGLADKSGNIIKYFSSGMKQRVKLCLAILSHTPVLLLDEPCSNLDAGGISWYKSMIDEYGGDRIIIVASNHNEPEYFFCDVKIEMNSLKL
jgi:ABC-type multidrug transport system ATPase subunit